MYRYTVRLQRPFPSKVAERPLLLPWATLGLFIRTATTAVAAATAITTIAGTFYRAAIHIFSARVHRGTGQLRRDRAIVLGFGVRELFTKFRRHCFCEGGHIACAGDGHALCSVRAQVAVDPTLGVRNAMR